MISQRLTELREARGLSKRALAHAAGINERTIRNIEANRFDPSWDTLIKLANALGTTMNNIAGR